LSRGVSLRERTLACANELRGAALVLLALGASTEELSPYRERACRPSAAARALTSNREDMTMAERTMPGLGLKAFYDEGQTGWGSTVSADLRRLSALVQAAAKSRTTPLPAAGALGDITLVPAAAASNANALALWDGPPGAEKWVYLMPHRGWRVFVADEARFVWFDGTAWVAEAAGGGGTTLAALADTDLVSTPPQEGDALVWDAATGKWKPGRPPRASRVFVTLRSRRRCQRTPGQGSRSPTHCSIPAGTSIWPARVTSRRPRRAPTSR
jgi:Protein of unknown function (DUF2793)